MSEESVNQFYSVAIDDEAVSEELSDEELKFVVGGESEGETLQLTLEANIPLTTMKVELTLAVPSGGTNTGGGIGNS